MTKHFNIYMYKLLLAFMCCIAVVFAQTVQVSQGTEQCSDGQLERIILVEKQVSLQAGESTTLEFFIDGDPSETPYENYVASDGASTPVINGVPGAGTNAEGVTGTGGWGTRMCEGSRNNQIKNIECGEVWRDLLHEGDNVVEFTATEPVSSVAVAAFYCPHPGATDVPEFGTIAAFSGTVLATLAILLKRYRRKPEEPSPL